jgi:hypothetical protein
VNDNEDPRGSAIAGGVVSLAIYVGIVVLIVGTVFFLRAWW